jgi:hypothetical protein
MMGLGGLLRPEISVKSAVLDGFTNVIRENRLRVGEIGNGAGDLENTIIRPGAEVQLGHGHLHHAFGGFVELAVALDLLRGHPGIAAGFGAAAAERGIAVGDAGTGVVLVKRWGWTSRAASMRVRMDSEDSPGMLLEMSRYWTAGTSTWMSMRSRRGPEMRSRWRWTSLGEQRHSRLGSPK